MCLWPKQVTMAQTEMEFSLRQMKCVIDSAGFTFYVKALTQNKLYLPS